MRSVRSVRIAVFVLGGIVLGVVGARMRTMRSKAKPWREHATRVASNAKASSHLEAASHAASPWTGFAYDRSVPQRDLLPTDARYDPVALSKEEEDLSVKEIFEREPRDVVFTPSWRSASKSSMRLHFMSYNLKTRSQMYSPAAGSLSQNRATIARPQQTAGEGTNAGSSAEQQFSMNRLLNAVITATPKDMHERGVDVMTCLDGVQLAGAEKIRFSVDVVSTPDEATTGRWRFVEIADGEPLPASFASCATRAFGGGLHLVPPKDFHFPAYRGDLSILYTIPAPSTD